MACEVGFCGGGWVFGEVGGRGSLGICGGVAGLED
jgi:hypothetical protein